MICCTNPTSLLEGQCLPSPTYLSRQKYLSTPTHSSDMVLPFNMPERHYVRVNHVTHYGRTLISYQIRPQN